MYTFDHTPFCNVCKLDIAAAVEALAEAEPLTFPTTSYVPLTELNTNYLDALTTDLATELARKRRHEEAASVAQIERVPGSYS